MPEIKPDNAGVPYHVPPEPSRLPSFLLAVAVHAALLAFLWIGVSWTAKTPITVEAEVWDMSVQTAAAPELPPEPAPEPEPTPEPKPAPEPTLEPVRTPPPPPPPPVVEEPAPKPAPDIALQREKERKAEEAKKKALAEKRDAEKREREREEKLAEQKKKDDAERKQKEKEKELLAKKEADEKKKQAEKEADKKAAALAAAEKKKEADEKKKADQVAAAAEKKKADAAKAKAAAAEDAKLAKLRADELKRMAGAMGSGGSAAKSTGPKSDGGYIAAITAAIKSSTAYPGNTDVSGNPRATFRVEQLPTGEIMSVRLVKSSGVPEFDRAVENGIKKASPLPKKKDGTVERTLDVNFSMRDYD
ncbi:cell envelope integrity protein TolA [Massilia aurea]|uniref:cell envelope integrity protein TolA n=1 Tax=Massilia aurea TaxID=373040 RepID=UPI00216327D0|nr:cell envelope integrity protein TolA [Massilia aurea]MCS0707601.1 cell envelope integrity protein TolA [Massilia aurea]